MVSLTIGCLSSRLLQLLNYLFYLDFTWDNIQLSLISKESENGLPDGSIDWIVQGIEIEEAQ